MIWSQAEVQGMALLPPPVRELIADESPAASARITVSSPTQHAPVQLAPVTIGLQTHTGISCRRKRAYNSSQDEGLAYTCVGSGEEKTMETVKLDGHPTKRAIRLPPPGRCPESLVDVDLQHPER